MVVLLEVSFIPHRNLLSSAKVTILFLATYGVAIASCLCHCEHLYYSVLALLCNNTTTLLVGDRRLYATVFNFFATVFPVFFSALLVVLVSQ